MNILQVLPDLGAGGVERTTIEIAQALSAKGHVPHVAAMGGRLEGELRTAGGILHKIPVGSKNPAMLRNNIPALARVIREHKIDLVHVRSRAPAWAAKRAARKAGIPFITTYHGIYNAKSKLKRYYNSVMAMGDIIIANSNFTKAHIIKEHGTDPEKIVVIARGVDTEFFDPANVSAQDIATIRREWGINEALPVLLLPGRLTRWKGQLVAVKALAHLGGKANLVLLGDAQGRDAYVASIKTLASELGLESEVILAAHTSNIPAALMAADIVLSASTDPEAFGRVAAEAQAMYKLVVATNHGGAMETVIDGETGRLVTPSNAKALAEGITDILNIPEAARKNMGKAARARIGREFSARALKKATLTVYEQAISAREAPMVANKPRSK